ncbi:MAG: gliding motility-associated C-terminal domain-containing protein [Bacteroidota bacterium]
MKRPRIIVFALLLASTSGFTLHAQNLVPNPSFETITGCPTGLSQYNLAPPWAIPPGSFTTPDLFNPCNTNTCSVDAPNNFIGVTNAFSGVSYTGILVGNYGSCTNCREYLQIQLTSPLVANTQYCLSMRVLRASFTQVASNNLGIYISNGTVNQPGNQPINTVIPQVNFTGVITDSANWTLVSGLYTAIGGENYITIGNFYDDINTTFINYTYPTACTNLFITADAAYYYLDSIFVGTCSALSITSSQQNVLCNGQCNGTATATPVGGTSPYTYSWNNGQTTQTATGLCAGTYTVTVTDAMSATATATVTITQPAPLVAGVNPITNVSCNALCNGSATATASGGTPGYTFSWNTSPAQSAATATGLCAGTYIVYLTDANGCSDTQSVVITQPPALVLSSTQVNICCFSSCTGSASVSASGGTPAYAYSWSPTGQTAQTVTGLCAGSYSVFVTDANGCTQSASYTITQPAPFIASANASTPSICPGSCTNLNGSATGGTAPYTYSWAPSGMTTSTVNVCPTATTTYTLFATDSAGCCNSNVQVTVTVTQITITGSSVPAACTSATGTATANPSGGAAPYSYSWNNGQTGQTASNLIAGTYTVTVTDVNGCTQTQTVTVTSGNPLTLTASSTPSACNASTGTATASPANGTMPYTYSWSNGQASATATGLPPGTYTVVVTDANGCSQTQTVSVTPSNGPIATANASASSVPPGGSSQLTATGGTSYSWYPSTGLSCSTCASPTATPSQTTTYCAVVTDAGGCSDTACVTIMVEIPCGSLDLSTLLPTAFSPNSDGVNNLYCVPANTCISSFVLKVYDRWGEKVFESSSTANCWDGTYKGRPVNTGVFVYYFDCELSTGEPHSQKGNITLIK